MNIIFFILIIYLLSSQLFILNESFLLLFVELPRRNIIDWVSLLGVSSAKNKIPESPIKTVIAISIEVMLSMAVEVKSSAIVSENGINTCKESSS
jgi:hypothetical protein